MHPARHHLAIVKQLCLDSGIPTEERYITVEEVLAADEIMLCSTTKNVIYVFEVDGKAVGGKDRELALKIQTLFLDKLFAETGVRL